MVDFTFDMVTAIFTLRQEGKTLDAIANKIGVNPATLTGWRKRNKISFSRLDRRGRAPVDFGQQDTV